MDQIDILSLPLTDLSDLLRSWGEPAFRAKQVFAWLHARAAVSFDDMTDLSKSLRAKLTENCYINSIFCKKKLVSALDGTVKYLYELGDGHRVESVLMHHHHGLSLCISTQVGCRMGCRFCASTMDGLVRNLTASEMLLQVYAAGRDCGQRIGGVVLMGIGEPLDNLENVLAFLDILSAAEGLGLSLRHVSLSTCGLVDKIDELAARRLPLTLSISLHAPDDKSRSAIMPVNSRWPVAELIAACDRYFAATGRRVSFEYALIAGETDTSAHARALAALLGGKNCHINLIPVNPVEGRAFCRGDKESIRRFQQQLTEAGLNATVRRELGLDIAAACGQLRRQTADCP